MSLGQIKEIPLMSLKMGHVGLTTRLLDQILEKSCVLSKGHIFSPKFMELGKNTCLNPLPNMPIFSSSNSATNDDMISKICTNLDKIV